MDPADMPIPLAEAVRQKRRNPGDLGFGQRVRGFVWRGGERRRRDSDVNRRQTCLRRGAWRRGESSDFNSASAGCGTAPRRRGERFVNQSASGPCEACRLEERGEEREFGVRLCEARRQGVGEERGPLIRFSLAVVCVPPRELSAGSRTLQTCPSFFVGQRGRVRDSVARQTTTRRNTGSKTTTPRMHWLKPTRPGCRLERREV